MKIYFLDDLLIHHIFIYLNSYDIMNIKKACNKYFYLIENNNLYSWKIALVDQTLHYANPTHVYYGKGNSIKNGMTKNDDVV